MLVTSSTFAATTPAEQGLAIAIESDSRDHGWNDVTAEMLMTLLNKQGESSIRKITLQNLEVDGDGDKSLTVFHEPKDVAGTSFLSFSHATIPDEQWIFLPALKKVKRISSSNKSGPFMGSEFAFEDLSSFEVAKYSYLFLREEQLDGMDCFVLELTPQYEHSGYKRLISWIDKAEYRIMKSDYYDRKDTLLKTLTFGGYEQYLDKFWRPATMSMVNHQNGKSTELVYNNYVFQSGLTDADFNKNKLKRAR